MKRNFPVLIRRNCKKILIENYISFTNVSATVVLGHTMCISCGWITKFLSYVFFIFDISLSVQAEIDERRRFLEDMEALGQGGKYRSIIATEISQVRV